MAKNTSNRNLKYGLIAIGAVIVVFLIIVFASSPTTPNPNAGDTSAPASLLSKLEALSNSALEAIGIGSATTTPQNINGPTIITNGKPTVLYIGAEYCPYCAAERWAMVIALNRFGSFTGLKETHSSTTDVFPDTQTFSFHGSTYNSQYVAFTPVEQYSNIPQGNGYTALDTPAKNQLNLLNTYDAPPYVPSSSAGAIPFIYFNGKYLITGASYSPSVLQNKSYDQIASALSNPNDPITKAIGGSANQITAAICGITNNQPSNVCIPAIQAIQKTFK